ncbi:general secretion pathway protein J [Thermosulfidibacter takaii ABI70S6]|uniref:General secretion pathway protein J n=1 Tax=Thermosulfidibacter takaii (strain DSM 17441 / JCM 13301 / NBRC 103674 / ABI70S6) TaxID=1298851 RepID=A0A0S3QV23_THET7|nr:prepilin-type N-terminal cleavage/methylation domain-containing protein [Thermosulfidibacter takaii]BAT72182.1 general secretion pathway protein J [Thermosulfidibacter takaii ABI70S6]
MRNRGFTLLEVLIALAVFALAFAGTYNLLNQALFTEENTINRIELVLSSSIPIALYWDTEPEETLGWKDATEDLGVGKYKIVKTPIGFYNIKKVEWSFKKNENIIAYILYY